MEKEEKKTKESSNKKDSAPKKKGRLLKGEVVSDKMDKTAVVAVSKFKKHSKYRKRYKVTKKYKAHDQENKFKLGDKVVIQESRPISRDKRWVVLKKYN